MLLIVTGLLFRAHELNDISFTACCCVVFFFASAGASAAYLTVSEVFPMETRALCIAVFYAVGTGIGGVIGPQVFSRLINTGSYEQVFIALALGAVMMILGGVAELFFGVKAEGESLESIAKPLTVEDSHRARGARRRRCRPASSGAGPERAARSAPPISASASRAAVPAIRMWMKPWTLPGWRRSVQGTPASRSRQRVGLALVTQRVEARRDDHRRRDALEARREQRRDARVAPVAVGADELLLVPVHVLLREQEALGEGRAAMPRPPRSRSPGRSAAGRPGRARRPPPPAAR